MVKDNKKILIIDDDELTRLTLNNVMRKADYAVIEAKDGNEGVLKYK